MDKISVIIPVYNSEAWLNKCLDSVVNQTYANLEILLIDDGSTDRSVEICDEYAGRDKRIRVFRKDTKGGSGSPCRSVNIGLKNFTGQYFGYVEPDDWIEPDMYEILYKILNKNNASVSIASFFLDKDNESVPAINKNSIPEGRLSADTLLRLNIDIDNYYGFCWTLWNRLFSADIIKNNNKGLFFNEKFIIGFDPLFNTNVFLTDGCVGTYTDKPLYHWVYRESSLSHSPENILRRYQDALMVLRAIKELLINKGYKDISLMVEKQCQKRIEFIELFRKIYLPKERYSELRDKNVLLFGSGYYGGRIKKIFDANKIKIKCYVDNDKAKHGKIINGIEVISPEKSLEIPDKKYAICINPETDAFRKVYKQLKDMNIPEKNIFTV